MFSFLFLHTKWLSVTHNHSCFVMADINTSVQNISAKFKADDNFAPYINNKQYTTTAKHILEKNYNCLKLSARGLFYCSLTNAFTIHSKAERNVEITKCKVNFGMDMQQINFEENLIFKVFESVTGSSPSASSSTAELQKAE